MTRHPRRRKGWRDFAHSLAVIAASAHARHELTQIAPRPAGFVRRFEVALLAAAGHAGLELPKDAILATKGDLRAAIDERTEEIWVTLQILHYAALRQNGGRRAQLISENGAIDYAFRFSETGTAVCVLANDISVKQGLESFAIYVAEGDRP